MDRLETVSETILDSVVALVSRMTGETRGRLGELTDDDLNSQTDIQPRTHTCLLQVCDNVVIYIGENMLLREMAPTDAEEWRSWMLTRE